MPCRRIVGHGGRQGVGVCGGYCLTMVGHHVVVGRGNHRQGGVPYLLSTVVGAAEGRRRQRQRGDLWTHCHRR